ncbi:MAG: beta-N-acetylglucosaminidase domain-containing protein [Limisphaerales bacterium]
MIEGFYGPPWSLAEREELLAALPGWGLDTYLYGPKDDLHHRARWREPYAAAEAAGLASLIAGCAVRGVRFFYALGPGLDLRFGDDADRERLRARLAQLLDLGGRHFALLFDDIPDRMRDADRERFGSFAAAQADVANGLLAFVRGRAPDARLLFCPTPYCGRMTAAGLGGAGYLETLGRALHPDFGVFWTGPEIISREITVAHVREVASRLRRKPVIWDNLHADDYDGRRVFLGPYAGRPPELRAEVAGILTNPNTEHAVNHVALRTLGDWLHAGEAWEPRAAYLRALGEWAPRFATVAGEAGAEDLTLFCDCFYLPHEDGHGARALTAAFDRLVGTDPAMWTVAEVEAFRGPATRLRDFCTGLAALRDRALFAALWRRVWELREELDLLLAWVRQKQADPRGLARSDFHLPGTYRGGFVARLQGLLEPRADGSFEPAAEKENRR